MGPSTDDRKSDDKSLVPTISGALFGLALVVSLFPIAAITEKLLLAIQTNKEGFMGDQLLGVVVGALIASLMPAITLWFEFRRWKLEKRLEHYRVERDRLERLFEELRVKLVAGMSKNSYPIDMIATLMHRCPDNVCKAFTQMMEHKDKTEKDYREHHLNIASEMNISLGQIEAKIEHEIK